MLRRLIGDLLNDALPAKTKRQIFLVSFAALFKDATSFDQETFQKLNRVLALSESNDKALGVPVILSKVIWSGKSPAEVCQEDVWVGSFNADRVASIVSNILHTMPRWMRYGEQQDMEKDVGIILNDRFTLLGV
jgi:hypothetical protein